MHMYSEHLLIAGLKEIRTYLSGSFQTFDKSISRYMNAQKGIFYSQNTRKVPRLLAKRAFHMHNSCLYHFCNEVICLPFEFAKPTIRCPF